MNALEGAKTIEVNREPDVDAADMAELLVRIDRRMEHPDKEKQRGS